MSAHCPALPRTRGARTRDLCSGIVLVGHRRSPRRHLPTAQLWLWRHDRRVKKKIKLPFLPLVELRALAADFF